MKIPRITITKHLIIVVVCVVVVFTLGVLSNKAWNNQVVKAKAHAVSQALIAQDAKRRQAKAVVDEKARLKTECDKEVAYYNSLSTAQKAKQTAPACQNLLTVQ